eukprot:170709-Rhodomonas_salina.2
MIQRDLHTRVVRGRSRGALRGRARHSAPTPRATCPPHTTGKTRRALGHTPHTARVTRLRRT